MFYYGYISKYKHASADKNDKVFIITDPCNSREEAEQEYKKIYNSLDPLTRCNIHGRNKGVLKIDSVLHTGLLEII